MRMYHGPIDSRPAAASRRSARLGLRADLEVVVDHRHLPVEHEVGVRRVGVELGQQAVEQVDEPGIRKVWNGGYHSRSQWVWGTIANRRARRPWSPERHEPRGGLRRVVIDRLFQSCDSRP